MEAPERIYLQIEIDDYFEPEIFVETIGDATWCTDRIHDSDVEYVRRDVAESLSTNAESERGSENKHEVA